MTTGTVRSSVLLVALTVAAPRFVFAQAAPDSPWTPEVSVGVGHGHVFRFDDETFGDRPNLSVALALRHRTGLGIEFEVNDTLGLTPRPAPCGITIDDAPAICVGEAHNGVHSATVASVTVQYQFGTRRLQPYVLAGLGVLHSTSVWSTATIEAGHVRLSELESRDTSIGPDVGFGIRLNVTPTLSVNPEVRWLDASLHSHLNLAVTRLTIRAGYSW